MSAEDLDFIEWLQEDEEPDGFIDGFDDLPDYAQDGWDR